MNKELYSIVSPCSNMLYNKYDYSNVDNDNDNDNNNYKKVNHKRKINMIFGLFITLFAMYLAYDCNRCESPMMRLFYVIVAGLFSGLYLLYYLVVRVFLGNKCGRKINMKYSVTSPEYNLFVKKNY